MKITKFLLLSVLFISFACTSDNHVINQSTVEFEQKSSDYLTQILSRYNIEAIQTIENEYYEFQYPDESVLIISNVEDNHYHISGSRANDNVIGFYIEEGELPSNSLVFTDQTFENQYTLPEVASLIHQYRSPCGDHPSGETFDDCVKREIDEFCDGFWGCVALMTPNGVAIVALMAIHCLAC